MAIAEMRKASIITLLSEKDEVVRRLQRFGKFQVLDLDEDQACELYGKVELDEDASQVADYEEKISEAKYVIDFINRYDEVKKSPFSKPPVLSEHDYEAYLSEQGTLHRIFLDCKEYDRKFADLKNREAKANLTIASLKPWLGINISLEDIVSTEHIFVTTGFVLYPEREAFINACKEDDREIYFEEISTDEDNAYFFLLCHKDHQAEAQNLLKDFSWTKIHFEGLTGTPEENTATYTWELTEVAKTKEELDTEAAKLSQHRFFAQALYDVFTIERDRYAIAENFARTEHVVLVNGWVPAKRVDEMIGALKATTDKVSIQFEEVSDDEEIPILLENSKLFRPLEMITEQFGLPNFKEIDPNFVMAPFYVMFFGMMVSDAGYGIVLALMTAAALYYMHTKGAIRKLLGILCLGGISTVFWGVLFGGWFGVSLKPLWFNPLDDPLKMLIFCLGIGVVQLYIGMLLNAYKSYLNGHFKDALMDEGLWLIFLSGLIMMAVPPVAEIGKYMAIGGAIGLVLTQGRREKSIIKKLLLGILSLYNVTGFLGDVLSYSRLFALGLATGVIGQVVNSMALLIGESSVIGMVLMVVFMVFGHTFNIAINVLGAYVHSCRLQYVEFFGKFYEGGGKPFTPFAAQTKYFSNN